MAGSRPLSGTEIRLFNQVCGAIHATSEKQKALLNSFISNEFATEWSQLMTLMESSGPLSVLSEDELKYLTTSHNGHQTTQRGEGASLLDNMPTLNQKTVDHDTVTAATHDLIQYNDVLEKLIAKYKDYVRRSLASMQQSAEAGQEASPVQQKIAALSRRKEQLKAETRILEDRVGSEINRLEGIAQAESKVIETGPTKCRASLDAVFLEASLTYNKRGQSPSKYTQTVNEERDAVYAEIQSLWDEMVPLAHMVVEKEFLKPISDKVESFSTRQSSRDETVSLYTSAMLRYTNERLRLLSDRIKMLVYHHQALLKIFEHARSQSDSKSTWRAEGAETRRKDNTQTKDLTIIQTIQRQMELYGSIPTDIEKQFRKVHTLPPHVRANLFDRYLTARQKKGDGVARNMHDFFERTAKTELTDVEFGSHLLLDSIVADSAAGNRPGGHVYEDHQVEDSVATMNSQVEEIQTVFEELRDGAGSPLSAPDFISSAYSKTNRRLSRKDFEMPESQEQCGKLSALVEKWGDSSSFTN
ncbi:hypothetical protein M426DRAFT_25715 [Hypoxylon sp. CI-4A]|nr:hypothetical protein M426DRAFT_25715 [Hypoxylon sp. CI-4A]